MASGLGGKAGQGKNGKVRGKARGDDIQASGLCGKTGRKARARERRQEYLTWRVAAGGIITPGVTN